jgi:molecular chaperone HtpG
VTALRDAHAAEKPDLEEAAELVYGMALLAEGGDLSDPSRFTRLLATRLAKTL